MQQMRCQIKALLAQVCAQIHQTALECTLIYFNLISDEVQSASERWAKRHHSAAARGQNPEFRGFSRSIAGFRVPLWGPRMTS